MLLANPKKKGSYTILVPKDYSVPKEGLEELVRQLLKPNKIKCSVCKKKFIKK